MTERDPLSASALAQVPEVRKALSVLTGVNYTFCVEAMPPDESALLLAIRDATLAALVQQTPEEVVEAAAKQYHADSYNETWETLDDEEREFYRKCVRAALPVLLAPTHAKLAEVEREGVALRGGPEGPFPICHDCGRRMVWGYGTSPSWICPAHVWLRMTAAEAERDRLRTALEEIVNADPVGRAWSLERARAALGGANA